MLTRAKKLLTRKRITEFLVVVTVIVGMCLILTPAARNVRNPNGPHGKAIPSQPPDEKNRIHHPAGISIVMPPNWEQTNYFGPEVPELYIRARGMPGARIKAQIHIQRAGEDEPHDLATCAETVFQGRPAYEKMVLEREWTFDDPAHSSYTLYFKRDGQWYRVQYFVALARDSLPEMVRQYINTLTLKPKLEAS